MLVSSGRPGRFGGTDSPSGIGLPSVPSGGTARRRPVGPVFAEGPEPPSCPGVVRPWKVLLGLRLARLMPVSLTGPAAGPGRPRVERAMADRQAASGACWSVNPTVSTLLPVCTREWYAGGTPGRSRTSVRQPVWGTPR
ncbi:hypothetical protein GCM10010236_36120 [Streptomyces eurythermus]|nr:hypothetical protein GCM10010236_36120 [Streptomyces eurythermus]